MYRIALILVTQQWEVPVIPEVGYIHTLLNHYMLPLSDFTEESLFDDGADKEHGMDAALEEERVVY